MISMNTIEYHVCCWMGQFSLSLYSTFSASKASLYEGCSSGGASTVETMTMAFKTPGASKKWFEMS